MENLENSTPGNNPLARINWSKVSWPKLTLFVIIGLVGIALVLTIVSSLFGLSRSNEGFSNVDSISGQNMMFSKGVSMPEMALEYDMDDGVRVESTAEPRYSGGNTGSYNEVEYEALSYDASIKTGDLDEKCDTIESWKPLTYILFERANRNSSYCSYSFKVEREQAATVLAELEKLDPNEINANTQVMKKQLVEYSGQLEILLERQTALEETLTSATNAYNELETLSKEAQEVETLSRVIDKKLALIERLTRDRISLSAQISALARNTAELTDRIEYVDFSVSVQKYEIFDGEAFKDSWVAQVRQFVYKMNSTLQDLSVGLLTNMLWLAQLLVYLVLYLVIGLLVAKYGWRAVRRFWQS